MKKINFFDRKRRKNVKILDSPGLFAYIDCMMNQTSNLNNEVKSMKREDIIKQHPELIGKRLNVAVTRMGGRFRTLYVSRVYEIQSNGSMRLCGDPYGYVKLNGYKGSWEEYKKNCIDLTGKSFYMGRPTLEGLVESEKLNLLY